MKFKAVLFDYDDTIANTYPPRVEAAKRAAEGYLDPGLDMDRIMKEWAGRPQMEIFSELPAHHDTEEDSQEKPATAVTEPQYSDSD